jgi:hypothetical protein
VAPGDGARPGDREIPSAFGTWSGARLELDPRVPETVLVVLGLDRGALVDHPLHGLGERPGRDGEQLVLRELLPEEQLGDRQAILAHAAAFELVQHVEARDRGVREVVGLDVGEEVVVVRDAVRLDGETVGYVTEHGRRSG